MPLPVLATAAGRTGWEAIVAEPSSAVVVSDFDGTLSPLVDDPATARAAHGALPALARLSQSVRQVALLTGRPALVVTELSGVNRHPGLERLIVLGHYGLERYEVATGRVSSLDIPPGVAQARARLPEVVAAAGQADAYIEDKGSSLAVHTRRMADPQQALEALREPLAALAEQTALRLEPGNLVLELRPPGVDKGTALRDLVAQTGASALLYAGDDLGDLAAYDAAEELRTQGLSAVLVATRSSGVDRLAERADVVVDDPDGVVTVLTALADAIAARG